MALPARRTGGDVSRWEPFREFEDLYDRMGRLLETTFGDALAVRAWAPAVDIEETDDAFHVEAELPGVKREDVNIELRDGELAITGEIKERERTGVLRRKTRRTGRFEYRVSLPGDVDAERVDAELKDGVLRIRAAKAAHVQPRRIEIKA